MTYEVIESDPFPDGGGEARYYIIRIENIGNKEAEEISIHASFPTGGVQEVNASNDIIVKSLEYDAQNISTEANVLNPGESISITATKTETEEASAPDILARAKGATATPKRPNRPSSYLSLPAQAAAAGLFLIIGLEFGLFVGTDDSGQTALRELRSEVAVLGWQVADINARHWLDRGVLINALRARTRAVEYALRADSGGGPMSPVNITLENLVTALERVADSPRAIEPEAELEGRISRVLAAVPDEHEVAKTRIRGLLKKLRSR